MSVHQKHVHHQLLLMSRRLFMTMDIFFEICSAYCLSSSVSHFFFIQLMDVNESPVYLLLNPAINLSQKDLPVTLNESESHAIDGSLQLIFVRTNYTIETVEAERIYVDHVAHLKPSDGGSAATQLAAHLTEIHSAIKMLNIRDSIIHQYLVSVQKGNMPLDNSLLRQVSSLVRRLPVIESEEFQDDFLMEYNDTLSHRVPGTMGSRNGNEEHGTRNRNDGGAPPPPP
ncbi:hypothetical protein GUJ93_ZPchr0010g10797 [Zizania palustris]|uniref:EIF3F/CSN6-like C-terminal domain-containing protein n=1 Tax=Zizania palustris TaxID=103762 RepID=A0A8J5WGK7_ZIZPA|nr:hypothetical protein GUJ93_ZPchr0010g10797 [Zizania palustris]